MRVARPVGRPSRPALSASFIATAAGLALGPAVALGFARFAYSLLLPAMKADLHWTFAEAGAMNTANAVGYLVGAIGAGPLIARTRSRRPYLVGLVVTTVALLASAATANFETLLVLRLVAGAAGAVVFIAGAGLVARLAAGRGPGLSAALVGGYTAGGGLGIVISAVLIPPVVGLGTGAAWRWGWLILAVASLLALAATTPAARAAPEAKAEPVNWLLGWPARGLSVTLVTYGLFGAGYVAYVTFIVSFLKSEGFTSGAVSVFWAILGIASLVAAFAWGPALGRLRGGRGPAAVLAMITIGALLPLLVSGVSGDFASAVLFGGAFLAVPAAVINLARRSVTPSQVAPAIAILTVSFGVGQSVGPVLAGVLSDSSAGVRTGLVLSVALLAVGTVLSLFQRAVPKREVVESTAAD